LARWWPPVLGFVGGTLVGALLLRLLFLGRSQTFDTLLYGRGLWGLARGDPFDPVLGVPTFALHAHLLALPLAPLTYFMPSAAVLALAQAAAFGATLALVMREAQRTTTSRWGLWFAVVVMCSPLITNPFLFDARPDLLGVPFLTAALLRASRRGGFDGPAGLLLATGALAREDFALVAAFALALAPASRGSGPGLWRLKARLLGSAALVAYHGLYFFAVRPWLGGSDASLSMHLAGQETAASQPSLWLAKLGLLGALVATAGMLPWLGWRWLGAAVPGCLLLLVSQWKVSEQLHFHYAMLAAPGLIVAAIVGLRTLWSGAQKRRLAWVAAASLACVAAYAQWSAAPGGRNFARFNFEMAGDDGGLRLARSPGTRAAHRALARIPDDHGVAVPWQLGAPLADRAFIWPLQSMLEHLGRHQRVPDPVDTVALMGEETLRAGRVLTLAHGFKLAGAPDGPIALLTRDKAFQRIPWDRLSSGAAPDACRQPRRKWPQAGLVLCELRVAGGRPTAVVRRTGRARHQTTRRSVHLVAGGASSASAARRPGFWIAGGLVNLADLPVDRTVELVADAELAPGEPVRAVLLDAQGREVESANGDAD